ncbi:hypothetical protein ACNFIC_00965 [Pseudomonas sp. NY15463]|jgi:hypothetical protein|uniref:hypothetical protein n=1 Tax=Pseudomonas sp. NY15463 TaxID=3400361 RepID=UPI003A856858
MSMKVLAFIASLMLAGAAVAQQSDDPEPLDPTSVEADSAQGHEPRSRVRRGVGPVVSMACASGLKSIGDDCIPVSIEFE